MEPDGCPLRDRDEDKIFDIDDSCPDEPENRMGLSGRRAASVKRYLVGQGIAEDRIVTRGAGPDEPRADNETRKGRQLNRRIEFRVVEQ